MSFWSRERSPLPLLPIYESDVPDDRPRCVACGAVDVSLTVLDIGNGFGGVIACAGPKACRERNEKARTYGGSKTGGPR